VLAPWSATELTGASLICGDWKPSPKCKKLWSTTSRLQTIDHFFTAAKAFSLTISIKKTEVLCQVAPDTTQPEPSIKIDGTALKNVQGFTYLGSCLSSFGSLDTEISCRLSKASSALGCLWTWIWHKRGITQETKLAVYRAVVLPTLLYGCKTWTCYCRHLKKLDQFHLHCLHRLLRTVTNQEILHHSSMPGVEVLITKVQFRWTGNIMRMKDSYLPKEIFCSEMACGTHRQGGKQSATKTPSRILWVPVISLLKAGSILQQIIALGGWQPRKKPKPLRKGDCHSLTSNTKPVKRGRSTQLLP